MYLPEGQSSISPRGPHGGNPQIMFHEIGVKISVTFLYQGQSHHRYLNAQFSLMP